VPGANIPIEEPGLIHQERPLGLEREQPAHELPVHHTALAGAFGGGCVRGERTSREEAAITHLGGEARDLRPH
jgi:hypothetical protein